MVRKAGQLDVDQTQLQQCVEGDALALAALREHYHPGLRAILISRGATETEAEDLLADLWGDCVPRGDDRLSLLEKFSGRCSLKIWLATVSTNRLYDLKRRHGATPGNAVEPPSHCRAWPGEIGLANLLHLSLVESFARCTARDLLMLRLVYLHDVTQREVGQIWGWHESKVSRKLGEAMDEIRAVTLQRIKQADPWLELAWQDFVDLCETHQVGSM